MNILVTGCHGQLGNEIQLLENNYPQHTYYNTDRDELDITDSDAIAHFVDEHHIDGIINCAATATIKTPEGFVCDTTTHACPVSSSGSDKSIIKVDACGIQCPGPILKLKQAMDVLAVGQQLEVRATDAGFPRDAEAWCRTTGHKFLGKRAEGGIQIVEIEKAAPQVVEATQPQTSEQGKTLILFSDDLDKTLATFVLANGAAATGKKVSIFFTFWGLNAIKKVRKPKVKKDIFDHDSRTCSCEYCNSQARCWIYLRCESRNHSYCIYICPIRYQQRRL